ncbi:MBL fold metallo-hydrolase [Marinobacter sp. 1-3A]|jgi:glyoxylase-like metal-dependent hydrolase (beta-lactamase superfamily II)|uniref:MBL fold metallo-hydrolase n=1 Tax=Marinobacter sp. 1-3A TaxID=2582920 RepID=UPI00190482CE|nr:MBL fold metallo-hydrolase [Marinobacter sp. 1-3A]MBK1875045.1 MBL fold metallo-hydrolase [Marinobacter sp. 1-3A]
MSEAAAKVQGVRYSPGQAEMLEVAPNVYWARIPLAGKLNHINVWLLRDADGFTLIDTGMNTPEARDAWRALMAEMPDGMRIKRVIVTHLHPDHVGLAGWLMESGAEEFWMTRTEYHTCQTMISHAEDDQTPDDFREFQIAAGWSDDAIEGYLNHYPNYGKRIYRLPRSYRRLEEGQCHQFGGHEWKVIVGSGHSPEHACLYSEKSGLFISGDQVLPGISSNVSVTPLEPNANPMEDWLASLRKLKNEVPDDVLVLPAHQRCFEGLHARIDSLLHSQEEAFNRLRDALSEGPKRVVDLFEVIFGRHINHDNFMIFNLATGEALACLNYLISEGAVEFSVDSRGAHWYGLR